MNLGDRMKEYENVSRIKLPRRAYTIIRSDGKNFHSYAKGLQKPFDEALVDDMDATAAYLCKNIMGAKFAFVQSDEISILLTDFDTIDTQAWFDNNLQKMCSVSASMATSKFNELRVKRYLERELGFNFNAGSDAEPKVIIDGKEKLAKLLSLPKAAEFDSRVWQIPQRSEVANYFIFRQQDATRNSIASVAQSLYSPKELNGKSSDAQQEMIFQKGINWNDYPSKYKRGRIILKETFVKDNTERSRWVSGELPVFTQDRDFLLNKIPQND